MLKKAPILIRNSRSVTAEIIQQTFKCFVFFSVFFVGTNGLPLKLVSNVCDSSPLLDEDVSE